MQSRDSENAQCNFKISDCTQHTMYTLYVCFILKSCCLVPHLHSLPFTSLILHPCTCPLSPPLVPIPSLFTDLPLNLYNTGFHVVPPYMSWSLLPLSSLPSPIFSLPCTHTVTEMLVNVLSLKSEDDDDLGVEEDENVAAGSGEWVSVGVCWVHGSVCQWI